MWGRTRPETRFEADAIVRISCRHCHRSWGQHAPDGRCLTPVESIFKGWSARSPRTS